MVDLDSPSSLLGGMTPRTFLEEYWQKKPLLIRGALTDFEPPIDADELAGLSMEEDVESRIVIEQGEGPWQLLQGPFNEETFASLPERKWTLLVQAVDHWVPEVQALKEQFQFLPSWRLDDVMISYAVEGGSVGPHYDQYDVFLIQVSGKRRWQVLPPEGYKDHSIEGIELHILDNFQVDPTMDWELSSGDILYLPPNFAHNGRATDDDCMTYSVGFRAPAFQDILTGIRDKICETPNTKDRFAAPESGEREHFAQIHQNDIEYLKTELNRLIDQPDLLAHWFGENISEVKYPELTPSLNQKEIGVTFLRALSGEPFFRPGDARICYYQSQDTDLLTVFCNGQSLQVNNELTPFIQAICNQTEFDFSGLDIQENKDLEPLLRFLIGQQGLIELTANEDG